MTEKQKLREAFEAYITDNGKWPNAILKAPGGQYLLLRTSVAWQDWKACAEALALPTAEQVDDINVAESFTSAAPEMPLSMNQFGRLVELTREHLTDNTFVYKATSKAGDTCHFGVESAAKAWAKGGTVEAIKVREFKLHTSSPTAAPVGEHELPPLPVTSYQLYYQWSDDEDGCGGSEVVDGDAYTADQMRAYARAALSAGDAVDGQSNASRWVASADRYPPEGERVFFMDLATNIVGFDMWAGEGFMWMPSHWMPIPPAPAMRKGQL
jgi:hypothetical protein